MKREIFTDSALNFDGKFGIAHIIPICNCTESNGEGNMGESGRDFSNELKYPYNSGNTFLRETSNILNAFQQITEKQSLEKSNFIYIFHEKAFFDDIKNKIAAWFDDKTVISFHQMADLKEKLIDITQLFQEIKFNLAGCGSENKPELISLANEFDADIYTVMESGELITIHCSNGFKSVEEGQIPPPMDNLDFFRMAASLDNISPGAPENFIIPATQLSVLLDKPTFYHGKNLYIPNIDGNFDVVRLIQIEEVSFRRGEEQNFFLKKVLNAMDSFDVDVLRLLINNRKGLCFYLGLKIRVAKKNPDLGLIEEKIRVFHVILNSLFPDIVLKDVDGQDWNNIQTYFSSLSSFGALTGYSRNDFSSGIWKQLENGIKDKLWGSLVVASQVQRRTIEEILYVLEEEETQLRRGIFQMIGKSPIDILPLVGRSIHKDPKIEIFERIRKIKRYIQDCSMNGLWRTSNYFFSEDNSSYGFISAIVRANFFSEDQFWTPTSFTQLSPALSLFVPRFDHINVEVPWYTISDDLHPFWSIYSSSHLSEHISMPKYSLSKYRVVQNHRISP